MIYNFLTSEDLELPIKEDLLLQIIGTNTRLIPKAESRAVKYMEGFLAARFKVADVFPAIMDWAANIDYKVSVPKIITYTDHLGNTKTETVTPIYYRDGYGKILNVVYRKPMANDPGKIYVAKRDNTNAAPEVSPDDWEEKDPRDENIIGMCADITLYYLHLRINPRKMPQLRVDMYNQAKEWLTLVKDDDLTPDLPKEIDTSEDIDTPRWGSSPQTGHYY